MTKEKNEQIRNSIKETRERRSGMICRVFEVKIINGKLSKEKNDHLDKLFLEGKWLRNSELGKGDLALLDDKATTAAVKVGDEIETRPLEHLSSQMKQDIVQQISKDVRALSASKKNGNKVGVLKFKSYCNCIPLRKYGATFRINFDNNTITIQGFKKPFKVKGLKQLEDDMEIANAKLVRKPSGYYFHITTFSEPESKPATNKMCGIDFGIGNNLTTSDDKTFNICVPESHAVKVASTKLNKSYIRNGRKKTKNHKKRQARLEKAYEKMNNKKEDLVNKTVSLLLNEYDVIAIQDEMIANWHKGLFGKQVQHSAMGSIKAKLKNSSKVLVVDRSFPSTQMCPVCGKNTKHPLIKREYDCSYCGYHHPSRDVKSADLILNEALRNASNYNVSLEQRAKSPVEAATSGIEATDEIIVCDNTKLPPEKQEAHVLEISPY